MTSNEHDHQRRHTATGHTAISSERGGELAFQLIRTMKMLTALRDRSPRLVDGVDHATQPLLYALAKTEGARISDLAPRLHADVSTVSRYATTLTKAGLVEKTHAPDDRRAQILTLTASGREAIAALCEQRAATFAHLLRGWTSADVDAFEAFLNQFADDVEAELDARRHDRIA